MTKAPAEVQEALAFAFAAAFGQQDDSPPADVLAGYYYPVSIAEGRTFTVGGVRYDFLQVADGDGGATIYTIQTPRNILQHKCETADWCLGFTVHPEQLEMVRITAPGERQGMEVPRWQTTTKRRCMIQGVSETCQMEIGFNKRALPPGDEDDYEQNSPLGEAVHRQIWTCNGDACEVDAPAEMDDDMDGDNGDGGDMDTAAPETAPADFTAEVSGAGASGQVALTWTATEGASGYKIYRNGVLIETIADGEASSYNDMPGVCDCLYTIAAYNDGGDSPISAPTDLIQIVNTAGVTPPAADEEISIADIEMDYPNLVRDSAAPSGANSDLRAGEEQASVPILVDEYADVNNIPVIQVQHLSYAHLGLWLVDNTFDDDNDGDNWQSSGMSDADDDGLEIVYHLLNNNRIIGRSNLPTSGSATYDLEGDVVYKGERFYPDNIGISNPGLTADFGAGTISARLEISPTTAGLTANHIGGDQPPGCAAGVSCLFSSGAVQSFSFVFLSLAGGAIADDGTFSGDVRVESGGEAFGFFSDLGGRNSADANTEGGFSGAFFDADSYDATTDGAPAEVGGVFSLEDTNGDMLTGGFLGAE